MLTPGEVWTREQLQRLRAARFTPAATSRFLIASWRRSAFDRAERPQLARSVRAWLALGAAAWLGPAAAGVQPFRRRLGAGLAWWGATAAMVDWHVGMFETEDGQARPLGAADALTLTRAWLVPVVAGSPTALVCSAAAATDALDGRLARRSGPTRAGREFDGLVDACFVLAALRGLRRAGRMSGAPAYAEATRLTSGLAYTTFSYLWHGRAPETRLLRAARAAAAMRFGGLVMAAAGRRRPGDRLLLGGSVLSTLLTARAVRRAGPSRVTRSRAAQ